MDTYNVGGYSLVVGGMDDARELVRKYHYSHRPPANVQLVMTAYECKEGLLGRPVAAVFFSIPPTRWKERVLELSRLVRADDVKIPLTRVISIACDVLRRNGEDLLVSFADSTQGHHGGIYQAASWNFHALRPPCVDGVMIKGQFVPGRSCNSKYGTRSPTKLSTMLSMDVTPHYDNGKYLYWRALNREGKMRAKALGLATLPYPKPTPKIGGRQEDVPTVELSGQGAVP